MSDDRLVRSRTTGDGRVCQMFLTRRCVAPVRGTAKQTYRIGPFVSLVCVLGPELEYRPSHPSSSSRFPRIADAPHPSKTTTIQRN